MIFLNLFRTLICYINVYHIKAGTEVLSSKSKYFNKAIIKAKTNQAENKSGHPIELNFRTFPKKTIKVIIIFQTLLIFCLIITQSIVLKTS